MNTHKIHDHTFKFHTDTEQGIQCMTINDNLDVWMTDDQQLELVKFLLDNCPKVQQAIKEIAG